MPSSSPLGATLPNSSSLAVSAAAAVVPDPLFAFTQFAVDAVRNNTVSHAELVEKERLRQELEAVLQALQPTARLVVYGSLANNLAIANCDMDLMDALHDVSVDLPALYTEALNSQGYSVKLLSKTRTPIVKVSLEHMAVPYCVDISFDNALALHNTKLIATYAACDSRVPILLMFVKLWTAVRRINDPHSGTLSSYGYALLLIFYLQNRCNSPPVLPNLQLISAMGTRSADELECSGYDIWFFKDVEKIQQAQVVKNTSSIGTLLEGFFSYFAYEFDFRDLCISIRTPGGIVTKTAKTWTQMVEHLNDRGDAKVKDRYILSIEDPFEIVHNVGRSVTRAGLYEIRGEFMAATRYVRGNKLDEILNPHRREIVAPTSSTAMHSPQQQHGTQQVSPGEGSSPTPPAVHAEARPSTGTATSTKTSQQAETVVKAE
ncbi:hypothetical protein BCR37DRAFT_343108 [Protomyces lactucae-debilis]|uniref:polynucleotide adenylyltransferase n=1 Tax=Protomyces lactucae-debilis TaxID=2754530 RepID=A0A1Y2FU17_PROLT|nr:uncharacterized protein BCR37DRAFT_343108 [Protomyces lactucae-debilis]ORY86794.1 hypothetical protein BCR37DRAFT_343108 [Protomyces lactucae-debilis]